MDEKELYEPMRQWLQIYLESKYGGYEIITTDSHSQTLERVLRKYNIECEQAIGIDIEIDILGIALKPGKNPKLFFIEAKKSSLTLKDLGQLWAYCKLINPEEAFLMTPKDLGSLNKIMNVFRREDLLDFGEGRRIKKMQIAVWNLKTNSPNAHTMIPKI